MLYYRREVVKVCIKGAERGKKAYVGDKVECPSWNELWQELYDYRKENKDKANEFFLCFGCRDSLREGKQHNKRSVFNDLDLDEIPKELFELNDMETALIQRAKCFQTIVRLGTVGSNMPASDRLQVIKGQVLH